MTALRLVSLALVLTCTAARAAPPGLPQRPLDLEFKQLKVSNMFRLLSQLVQRSITVAPCAADLVIDLKLVNVTPPLIFDAVASKLDLVYLTTPDDRILVECARTGVVDDPAWQRRVSVDLHDQRASTVLASLALAAGLRGARVLGDDPVLPMTLRNVTLRTATAAWVESLGGHRHVELADGQLVAPLP